MAGHGTVFNFWRNYQIASQILCFHQQCIRAPAVTLSHQFLVWPHLFNLPVLMAMLFICTSPETNEAEHLSTCLFQVQDFTFSIAVS